MKAGLIPSVLALAIGLTACSDSSTTDTDNLKQPQAAAATSDNPFFNDWGTPFEAPDFAAIKEEHFLPAFEQAMAEQKAEVDAIVNNSDAPTFDNTIVALDRTGARLAKVGRVFSNLTSSHTSDKLQELSKELSPVRSAHSDDIKLNQALFQRVKSVYDQRDSLDLNTEQMRLLEKTYKGFVRGGANLQGEERETAAQTEQRTVAADLAVQGKPAERDQSLSVGNRQPGRFIRFAQCGYSSGG